MDVFWWKACGYLWKYPREVLILKRLPRLPGFSFPEQVLQKATSSIQGATKFWDSRRGGINL